MIPGRRLAVAVATSPLGAAVGDALTRGRAVVFMLHRLQVPESGIAGHDPAALRDTLAYLRRRRYDLLPLEQLWRALGGEGPRPRRAVAFTLDDGYLDQATIAADLFAEFDCPATLFVTSGFLDGALWLWWDRLEFMLRASPRRDLAVEFPAGAVRYSWATAQELQRVHRDIVERCVTVPDDARRSVLEQVETATGISPPQRPPAEYAPMTWDLARRCEQRGMRIGPHSVTHPALAHTDAERSHHEIAESWRRVQAECRAPVPLFCYPHGGAGKYGAREQRTVRALGLLGGLSADPGYALFPRWGAGSPPPLTAVPRFAWSDDPARIIRLVTGIEGLRALASGTGP